jgi:hypothetical protein
MKYYAIAKAYPFSSLSVFGNIPLMPDEGQPTRFMPVFDTIEQARKFAPDSSIITLDTEASQPERGEG